MAQCLINPLRMCGARFLCGPAKVNPTSLRCIVTTGSNWTEDNGYKREKDTNSVSHTTILVQQGCDIQELPIILRRANQEEVQVYCSNNLPLEPKPQQCKLPETGLSSMDNIKKIIRNLRNSNEILEVSLAVGQQDMTVEMIELFLLELMNVETQKQKLRVLDESENEAYMGLVKKFAEKAEARDVIKMLREMTDYYIMPNAQNIFCNELALRSNDGMLSIVEICEAVTCIHVLSQKYTRLREVKPIADRFWSGLADQENKITAENIKFIYEILPMVKVSRRMIVGLLERRMPAVWWYVHPDAMISITSALAKYKLNPPPRTMQSIGRWLNTNIHQINEDDLDDFVRHFTKLDYSDDQIEKALERYVKLKGIKITSNSLVAAILTHSVKFRIRNAHIFNGCSEYLILHGDKIQDRYMKLIVTAFGMMNIKPTDERKFWTVVENFLNTYFRNIGTGDVIDFMMCAMYLQTPPLNFVDRVFNPEFLDRMHLETSPEELQQQRDNLKLFDTALTLECDRYKGPKLPKEQKAKFIWQDGRIKRMANNISNEMMLIAGGEDRLTKSAIMHQLPMLPLYVIDFLLHPVGMGRLFNYNPVSDRNVYVAVLIMLPDYYDKTGETLMGPQAMKIRHLQKKGLKVVTLNYEILAKLRVHSHELLRYLEERMKMALPATPVTSDTTC